MGKLWLREVLNLEKGEPRVFLQKNRDLNIIKTKLLGVYFKNQVHGWQVLLFKSSGLKM